MPPSLSPPPHQGSWRISATLAFFNDFQMIEMGLRWIWDEFAMSSRWFWDRHTDVKEKQKEGGGGLWPPPPLCLARGSGSVLKRSQTHFKLLSTHIKLNSNSSQHPNRSHVRIILIRPELSPNAQFKHAIWCPDVHICLEIVAWFLTICLFLWNCLYVLFSPTSSVLAEPSAERCSRIVLVQLCQLCQLFQISI